LVQGFQKTFLGWVFGQRYKTDIRSIIVTKKSTTGNDIDPNGVDHPKHYNVHPSGVECIEVVRHMTFNLGNVVKYLWRDGIKDTDVPLQDLNKAAWYLNDEIARRTRELEE
jgi:hypothetical protein